MSNVCKKQFLDSNFNKAVHWQNIDFSRNCPKFHIFTTKNDVILKVLLEFFRPTASKLIDFMAVAWEEYSYSSLPVLSRLDM